MLLFSDLEVLEDVSTELSSDLIVSGGIQFLGATSGTGVAAFFGPAGGGPSPVGQITVNSNSSLSSGPGGTIVVNFGTVTSFSNF